MTAACVISSVEFVGALTPTVGVMGLTTKLILQAQSKTFSEEFGSCTKLGVGAEFSEAGDEAWRP